jgi:hypothetical protein
VDEIEAAIFGHAIGQQLGGFEMVKRVNSADRLGVVIADVNNPRGIRAGLATIGVCGWHWAIKINRTIRADVGKFRSGNTHKD